MKRFLAITLSALIALSFAGCRNNDTEKSDVSENSASGVKEETSETSLAVKAFDFADYESGDVFDIEKTDMSSETEAECTTYEFRFLSDGYRIKGYISVPSAVMENSKPRKCILHCRGGNSQLGRLAPSEVAGICAATGRVAVACELRGCNGSQGMDQFGGDDLHDVIKLIDLCENQFSSFIDMEDFCVEGESRGGMMTYMTARQDKRVKKIIVVSGVSDLFAAFAEREENMTKALVRCIGGTPEEVPEEYEKRSAVYWAEEIKIPVLMIHSRQDIQAKYETQAEAVYKKLKETTNCKLITHEDDVHGFHNDDFPEILDWIENT